MPWATIYLKNMFISSPSTKSIQQLPIGPPSEAYPLGAQGMTLLRRAHLRLRTSLPNSVTRQPMGTQGKSRSICGIGVPPLSRHSGTVSDLGAHHAGLRFRSTILLWAQYFACIRFFVSAQNNFTSLSPSKTVIPIRRPTRINGSDNDLVLIPLKHWSPIHLSSVIDVTVS